MSRVTQAHRDTYAQLGAVRIEQVYAPEQLDQATALIDEIIAALRAGEVPPRERDDPVLPTVGETTSPSRASPWISKAA